MLMHDSLFIEHLPLTNKVGRDYLIVVKILLLQVKSVTFHLHITLILFITEPFYFKHIFILF